MSKNFFQDMIKIKNENRAKLKHKFSEPVTPPAVEEEMEQTKEEPPVHLKAKRKEKKGRSKRGVWFVAVLCTAFLLYSLSFLFLKAEVAVRPKTEDLILNENLSASKDGSGEELPFSLIIISDEAYKTVQAKEEKFISSKSSGTAMIYNAYSSTPQKLAIDTRLEGSNGKIYKTKKAIVIEGMKNGTPGSAEVGIYAAEAGENYNSSPLDFTILGFKGTPKYSKFYGRSVGDIAGGFKGNAPYISEDEKASAINDLKTTLEAKLFQKATGQIPNGFILFKNALVLNVDSGSTAPLPSGDKTLEVKLGGTLYGFLFDEQRLVKKIAKDNIEKYDDSPVYIQNIRDLTFSFGANNNISSAGNLANVKNISFNISGPAKIVYQVDADKLAADLLGKSRKDFKQLLSQYPSINSADLILSPFWKMSLPDKAKNINVMVNYPK